MKKIRGHFNKMNNFIKGDDLSKIHSDEKPLYEFSKKVLENQFVAEVYPNQNGALIKIILNETERIINIEKNESFQLKFGLIGTKLEIENFISNTTNKVSNEQSYGTLPRLEFDNVIMMQALKNDSTLKFIQGIGENSGNSTESNQKNFKNDTFFPKKLEQPMKMLNPSVLKTGENSAINFEDQSQRSIA